VTIQGNDITVGMSATSCAPPNTACDASCIFPRITCALPPLNEGTYTVKVAGEGQRIPARTLVVTAQKNKPEATTSCSLSPIGQPPPPLNPLKYSTSCSNDDDCMIATTGNLCQPCQCPNTAIAKASSPLYEADARAGYSQCATSNNPVLCAGCAPAKAKCKIDSNALTGTCIVQPGF